MTELDPTKLEVFTLGSHETLQGKHTNLGPLYTRDLGPVAQYTSSTLIGGEGEAGPSSLHTMLEGPTEYVNARWM
jgi:hypothetical protein